MIFFEVHQSTNIMLWHINMVIVHYNAVTISCHYCITATTIFLKQLRYIEMLSEDVLKMCYRFHKLKHLPLLNLLHFEDVFQRDLVEVLPHVIHLVICLRKHNRTKHIFV